MPPQKVRIRDCELVQTEWLRQSAFANGGKTFSTHHIDWVWNPAERCLYALFPTAVDSAGLRPALAEAVRLGAKTVGLWTNAAVRVPQALAVGFEVGWQPWWMAAAVEDIPDDDGRLRSHRGLNVPPGAWLAELERSGERLASGALFIPAQVLSEQSKLDKPAPVRAGLAGIFDMSVAEPQQRQGLGTQILRTLSQRARQESVDTLVLNSTPAGQRLYLAHGFELIGRGQTYWLQL